MSEEEKQRNVLYGELRYLKRSISKSKEYVDSCLQNVTEDAAAGLETFVIELTDSRSQFEKVVSSLWSSIDQNNQTAAKKEEDDLFSIANEVKNIVLTSVKSIREAQSKARSANPNSESVSTQSKIIAYTTNEPKAKLPDIPLPEFDGDYRKFINFYYLFKDLVHDKTRYSKIEKLHYLKGTLKGNATSILDGITVSEDAYDEVWERLQDRYMNNKIIVQTHLNDLFSTKKIKNDTEIRELLDVVDPALRNLKICGADDYHTLVSYLVYSKLDDDTKKDFENSLTDSTNFPKYDVLKDFLKKRAANVESRLQVPSSQKSKPNPNTPKKIEVSLPKKSFAISTNKLNCHACSEQHLLIECKVFKEKTPRERFEIVKENKLCNNCFSGTHRVTVCGSNKTCKICRKKHHTLLHYETPSKNPSQYVANQSITKDDSNSTGPPAIHSNSCLQPSNRKLVVLRTAVVRLKYNNGTALARVLFDEASQPTLISDTFVRKLKLPIHRCSAEVIQGIEGVQPVLCEHSCSFTISSRINAFSLRVHANVAPTSSLSYRIPDLSSSSFYEHIKNYTLAEQDLDSRNIDIILGAEYVEMCYLNETVQIDNMTLRNTHFGWTFTGSIKFCFNLTETPVSCCNTTIQSIDDRLKKFWELEQISSGEMIAPEEETCDQFFLKNYHRNQDGKFVLRLPFKTNKSEISNTKNRAIAALKRIESRTEITVRKKFHDFMDEYERLGHMTRVSNEIKEPEHTYYIPYQLVLRPSSTTSDLRVVFNASAKCSDGISLNEALMKGPNIQSALVDILIEFRSHNVVLTGDVEKMYRQAFIHKDDRDFQRIVYRKNPSDPISIYQLNTITYGTTPGSFLATKCLDILADTISKSNPIASKIIKRNFYMDDLLCGADNVEDAIALQRTIHSTLLSGGFPLRKYMSNSEDFLKQLDPNLIATSSSLELQPSEYHSVLGLVWNPKEDTFTVKLDVPNHSSNVTLTKRIVLSEISRVFDPLSFLAPVTIRSKLMLQDLWREELDWDDPVSSTLAKKYRDYNTELLDLKNFSVRRRHIKFNDYEVRQIVGFCDASEKAYCASIYLRAIDKSGNVSCYLICARSRVAPIKELTIPKLELQAAALLAELIDRVSTVLNIEKTNVFAFSDSTVVLSWLRSYTSTEKLPVFVKNRVMKISKILPFLHWNYVYTKFNPADLATRGLLVKLFLSNFLWTNGPEFLYDINFDFTLKTFKTISVDTSLYFTSQTCSNKIVNLPNSCIDLLSRYSSYSKLINILSYMYRFSNHCKQPNPMKERRTLLKSTNKFALSVAEREIGENAAIRLAQSAYFREEIHALENEIPLKNSSSLLSLSPFLDSSTKILRVGGRLRNSNLPTEVKHPIILPAKSPLTELYIRYLHTKFFHCNRAVILAHLAGQYWFVGGITPIIKRVIKRCVICIRFRGQPAQQIMGQLPAARVNIDRPFSQCGVDLAGPFECVCLAHRTYRSYKAYSVIFVCMVTRAVHIEATASLTAESFLNALKRFSARRGYPKQIHSDNATNFKGTKNYFRENQAKFEEYATSHKILWNLNTPRASHQGGIWEAAVKSAKFHLVRVMGNKSYNIEEFSTIFACIEAILNSRPLCYRNLPNQSFEVITPGHFLIGAAPLTLPDHGFIQAKLRLTERYDLLRSKIESFWDAWKRDYLNQLQPKSKWKKSMPNLNENDVVIIKDDDLKPAMWKFGRITKTFADANGHVRNVNVYFNGAELRRAVTSLIPLPLDEPPIGSSGGEC